MAQHDVIEVAEGMIRYAAKQLPHRRKQAVIQALDNGEDPKLISEQKAADLLAVSKTYLWRWRHKTETLFPFHVFPIPGSGNSVKYDYNEVISYITEHMYTPGTKEDDQS